MARSQITLGQTLTCAETGKQFVAESQGRTVNYATDDSGYVFSDEGVDIRERRELLDRSRPAFGYISCDGKAFTGWKGNKLGTVTQSSQVRSWRRSSFGDLFAYSVTDVHGGKWHGRGAGNGVCIKLRPSKA